MTIQRETARHALRHCASLVGAPDAGWDKSAGGVPLPNGPHHWSISHKRLWAAAVMADHPVGIDIEAIEPRQRRLHHELASETEWSVLGDESWDAFFRLWTAKEATLKANGLGIGALRRCVLTDPPHENRMALTFQGATFRVEHFRHDGHIAAVTCGAQPVDWHIMPMGGTEDSA